MRRRSDIARSIGLVSVAAVLSAGTAWAHTSSDGAPTATAAVASDDFVPPAHPMYKADGVTVDEHLGARVPLDATFRTQDGQLTTLRQVLAGELPTILTFNYSDCPMLCSLQLNGLANALPTLAAPVDHNGKQVTFELGKQFRVVTIDLEPRESIEKMAQMRDRYVAKLPAAQQKAARDGWTFLVAVAPGDDSQIRRVAEAVGFKYTYVPERAEWAHPAALIFVSSGGTVTRYVYGIEYEAQVMRDSILKAGLSEAATAVGFMNRCYHFDPDASSHARAGVMALRLGAAGFLVLLVTGLGVLHAVRRRRAPGES
jgi:protein SCO1/2